MKPAEMAYLPHPLMHHLVDSPRIVLLGLVVISVAIPCNYLLVELVELPALKVYAGLPSLTSPAVLQWNLCVLSVVASDN
jgi:hypothetical protein